MNLLGDFLGIIFRGEVLNVLKGGMLKGFIILFVVSFLDSLLLMLVGLFNVFLRFGECIVIIELKYWIEKLCKKFLIKKLKILLL